MKNRKMKFRVWNPDDKVMLYDNNDLVITLNGELYSTYDKQYEDSYIIQQYTGVKDKNGKKIYEGDMLEYITDRNKSGLVTYESDFGGYIVKGKYSARINNTSKLDCDMAFESKILGNIFENPELLTYNKL